MGYSGYHSIHIFNISCESDGAKVHRATSFLDVVLVLLLGGNISNALSDEKVGLLGSMITTFILVVLHIISSVLMLKWDRWRRFLEPAPIILIHNGSIDFSNLKKRELRWNIYFRNFVCEM